VSSFFIDILIAYILDLIFGDPHWLPHPIKLIGNLIRKLDRVILDNIRTKHANSEFLNKYEKIGGLVLLISVIFITFTSVFMVLHVTKIISYKIVGNSLLFHIVNIYLIYSSFATKCLGDEAMKIHSNLANNDIPSARKYIGYLVSRETSELDEGQITKATVETVAENTVDGATSPLFYAFIGGIFSLSAPVVYIFKSVSTLDSMVGYKNDRYNNFGMFSAKFDDILNYIPARITGFILVVSAALLNFDYKNSFKILLRDRRNHKSPNCAFSESAVAGALNIQLGGNNIYFGQLVEKPTIGDHLKPPHYSDIEKSVHMLYISSLLTLIFYSILLVLYISWQS
jgi:adenosylcobinamide-phosphate synthase